MIENLVFEGGGVKGIAYCGVLKVLDEMGVLNGIKRVAGTSAGGITAMLLAIGYDAQETGEIVKNTPFHKFKDDDFGVIRDSVRLFEEYGIYKGDFFYDWISGLIEQKIGDPEITFAELAVIDERMDLYLTGTNLTRQRTEVYSHMNTPTMQIREAVRITMSIPFFFRAIVRKDDILVDGGLIYNYPIDIFDDQCDTNKTIGFRVDSSKEINAYRNGNYPNAQIVDFSDFVLSIFQLYSAVSNREHLSIDNYCRTGFIDSLDIGTTEFDITPERIEKLVQSGENGARTFFEKFEYMKGFV